MGQFDYPFVHNGYVAPNNSREVLNKSISLMVRQAHHERNQTLTVRPEPVEGFNQRFPRDNPIHLSFPRRRESSL
jgi:hypothetical protein